MSVNIVPGFQSYTFAYN